MSFGILLCFEYLHKQAGMPVAFAHYRQNSCFNVKYFADMHEAHSSLPWDTTPWWQCCKIADRVTETPDYRFIHFQ